MERDEEEERGNDEECSYESGGIPSERSEWVTVESRKYLTGELGSTHEILEWSFSEPSKEPNQDTNRCSNPDIHPRMLHAEQRSHRQYHGADEV